MQEKGNITGVTIWSVSDDQNFVVHLTNKKIYQKNLERKNQGLEPIPYIKTLYGGYYNSKMQDIVVSKSNKPIKEFDNDDKKGFDMRSSKEIEVANMIKEKNKMIVKEKVNRNEKVLVKGKTDGGFISALVLSLISGITIGVIATLICFITR